MPHRVGDDPCVVDKPRVRPTLTSMALLAPSRRHAIVNRPSASDTDLCCTVVSLISGVWQGSRIELMLRACSNAGHPPRQTEISRLDGRGRRRNTRLHLSTARDANQSRVGSSSRWTS